MFVVPGRSIIPIGTRHRIGGYQNGHRAADTALARFTHFLFDVDVFEFERERRGGRAHAKTHPSLVARDNQHQRHSGRRIRLGRFLQSARGTSTVALVQSRRSSRYPERTHQRTPGTRFNGDCATTFLFASKSFGSHRQRDPKTCPAVGHVLQTGSLLGIAHRLVASFGR